MDGPDRIRFSMAKPYWNEQAAYLDPPSITSFNNWEGLAQELEFKMREIEHIKHIRHESGSNTIIMFEQYVQRTNGGDLHQVLRALDKLKRRDAFEALRNKYEDIKARNLREYGTEPMVTTPPQVQVPMAQFQTQHHVQGPMASIPHQPHVQGPMGSLPHQPQGQGSIGSIPHQPQVQGPMGGIPHQPQVQGPMGGIPHQPQVQGPMGGIPHQPQGQRPIGSIPLQPQGQGSIGSIPHQPQGQGSMGSIAHQAQLQQDIILQQQRQIQQLQQQQKELYEQYTAPLNQARYRPTPEQIPQHLWPQIWLQLQAEQRMQVQKHSEQVQDIPMNLKKTSPPLTAPINLLNNFNKRTDKDFPIGFTDQFRPHYPDSNDSLEPQMDSLRSLNQSLGVPSMLFSGPKEYPAEFTEVLGRAENNLASLTPEPMVIAPIPDRPSNPIPEGNHKSDLMDFSVSDSNKFGQSDVQYAARAFPQQPQEQTSFRHFSDESYLSKSARYTRTPSGGLVRDTYPLASQVSPSMIPHGAFPIGKIIIKQEAEDAKPMEVAEGLPAHPRTGVDADLHHQQRQSVIQAGPQCNSLPAASPGDISQMSSPGTVKDELDTEPRAHSLEERPTQKLAGKQLRPKRYTWPMGNKELKERKEPPKPEPPNPLALAVQAHGSSVDRNYKQLPFKKKPVKVLLTYTMDMTDAKGMKNHRKELTVLYNCLLKNDFLPSLDLKEEQEFNRDMQRWIDTRYREANFVIVCISPQYKRDIAHHDDFTQIPQNRYSKCCRYIHNLMQNEFVHQGSHNRRFLPVRFPGSTDDDIPMWMRSIVAFRWREHWRDIMYMMLEPKDIIVKIKGNKERFTEQQEAPPIIRMTQSCS